MRVGELEWPDGLRLDDLEVDVSALQTIKDVRELAGHVEVVVGSDQGVAEIFSHCRPGRNSSTTFTAENQDEVLDQLFFELRETSCVFFLLFWTIAE